MSITTSTTIITAVAEDNDKILITTVTETVNGATSNTTITQQVDKVTYLANQYQVIAQATTRKNTETLAADAIITAAQENIDKVNAL